MVTYFNRCFCPTNSPKPKCNQAYIISSWNYIFGFFPRKINMWTN